MQIKEVMTPDINMINPEESLQAAAQMMADLGAGVLPVGENDRLVGTITDRDITVRAVAKGLDPESTKVRTAMSGTIYYCLDDETADAVAQKMGQWQVRRLPVLNHQKRLVGIVSLGDLTIGGARHPAKAASHKISK
jgi:CBS domain-containing protein